MGFRVTIDGNHFEPENITVNEEATPLAAGDSSGSTGSISFTVPDVDPFLTPNHHLAVGNPAILLDNPVKVWDDRKGYTLGRISSVSRAKDSALLQVQAVSMLNDLNVYRVQAEPQIGSVQSVFAYYAGLSGTEVPVLVVDTLERSLSTEQVVFPGWTGELWYHMKQMAYSIDADISLVSGYIVLRPIRARVATRGRDVSRTVNFGGGSLAQYVEVYNYNNRAITDELVYPPGGWSPEVTVINVNAGETVEQVLELSASVTSIEAPSFETFVSKNHDDSSVFTIVGDDGLPVTEAAWVGGGGSLGVTINPDTTSLTVSITAPAGVPRDDGLEFIQTFSVSLSDDSSTGRYSTLRVVGSGVAFSKEAIRIPTGVSEGSTGTEVGVTIDNPFIGDAETAYRSGLRAVRSFNGSNLTINGTVVAVNQRGDSGIVVGRTWGYVEELQSGKTWGDVQAEWGSNTYAELQVELNQSLVDEFDNQVYGNVNGARVWDEYSRRWYRVRSASLTPGGISFEAEDDLLHGEVQEVLGSKTYEEVQDMFEGLTYRQVDALGVPRG